MKTSRIKFVVIFLVFAVAFLFGSHIILEQSPETLIGTRSESTWKSVVSIVLSPIKVVLMGPLLPFIKFLRQDPDTPPPFYLMGFAMYWTILAVFIHFLLGKIRHAAS